MSDARERYPCLFSALDLGPVTLRNRAVIPGHSMLLGHTEPGVSPAYRAYLAARAEGGAALVGIASAPMHESTRNLLASAHVVSEADVPPLARAAEQIHRAGAAVSIILWHAGHNAAHRAGAPYAVAPSPIPSVRVRETPRVLRKSEIKEIVAAYGLAARRCADAGIDVIEVQTATDYLLGSFMSPRLNWREDEYGGSLENRMRIVCEVLESVREAVNGKLAVGVRTSVAHEIPTDPEDYGIEASLACMGFLAERGLIDYVSLLTGSHWSMSSTIPPMSQPRLQLAAAGRVFKDQLRIPVVVSGRIRTAAEAESMLSEGQADLIGMARTWIAEPRWLNKVEQGREEEIRPCMSCSQGCFGFVARSLPGTCIINPTAGRELELSEPQPAARPKRIAVIGGGPAGLETARLAALRGHRVDLYEATDRLGGQMRLAAEAPLRGEMLLPLAWWASELHRLGVRVHLNQPVSIDAPPAADQVVWAVGGEPAVTQVWRLRPHLRESIPGAAHLPHGRDVMAGTARVAGRVLVIDEEGGWPVVSLCETLAGMPGVAAVEVVTAEACLGGTELEFYLEGAEVAARVRAAGIVVHPNALVDEVARDGVRLYGGGELGPFDAIVMATGTRPRAVPEDALAVGDCIAPRGIWAATRDATVLAAKL